MHVGRSKLNRRRMLSLLAAGAGAAAAGASIRPARSAEPPPKFAVVVGAFGGASIIDSFLAIRESECASAASVNCFPDAEVLDVTGSPLRAVNLVRPNIGPLPFAVATDQKEFVDAHKDDMAVMTWTTTSVNHTVGQKRAITGNNAWAGRTLQECVALQYGKGFPLPNVNMATMGYAERGEDPELPAHCYAEPVALPKQWPLSLDGMRGIKGAPDREIVAIARELRDARLDPETAFHRTFQLSEVLQRWKQQRTAGYDLEERDLITKLNMFEEGPDYPLGEYGLASSADAALIADTFPLYLVDPLEAQAALAFLLIKYRVSVAVTIAPTFGLVTEQQSLLNPPLAFDFSHNAHRATQAAMWKRTLDLVDRLIGLLKGEEFDASTGESLWDRTLIYVATDFGRTKTRNGGEDGFGSGHDLNNGVVVMSPFVRGNRVFGGVDKATGMTWGFDPLTGNDDPTRNMREDEVFAAVAGALDLDTTGSGLPAVPVLKKG